MILVKPPQARALYVFAHGAGAGMRHSFMEAISAALAERGIATARYEFPYMAGGRKRPDPPAVLEQCVRESVAAAAREGLPLVAGGKSMGGRITSQAQAAEPLPGVRGIVFLGFPLHPAGAPATKRAEHLSRVKVPMLFVQGTRDKLAELPLLEPIVRALPAAELRVVQDADHSFKAPKQRGDVLGEIADAVARFALAVCG